MCGKTYVATQDQNNRYGVYETPPVFSEPVAYHGPNNDAPENMDPNRATDYSLSLHG